MSAAASPENQSDNKPGAAVGNPVARTDSFESEPRRLSEELQRLIEAFLERSVRLREVLEVMQGRGYTVLLILVTFPFCTPLPMPGLSMPFGLIVACIGFRLALGRKPWLPERLLDTTLPVKFFPRVLATTCRLVKALERFLKPRARHILHWRLTQRGMGLMIFASGLLMMLPFPIPFSNGLPALCVLLISAAMLEQDGYVAVAGAIVFALSVAFFVAVFWGGAEVVNLLREMFSGFLRPDDKPPVP